MPEARIILSQAALSVACSPKSNSAYMAIESALKDVAEKQTGEVPFHLRNAPAKGMSDMGYVKGYKYAHDYPGNYVEQEYLPDKIKGTTYYESYSNGYEEKIKEWLDKKRPDRNLQVKKKET
jgi:putative ATPase